MGDGATEENAKLEGWQEKQRVSTTCRSDIKPALQPCKNCGKPRGRERINYPNRTPRDKKKRGVITGDTDGNGSETG